MTLTINEKTEIFGFISKYFSWVRSEEQSYGFLHESFNSSLYDAGFSYETGATKCCVFHEDFYEYVVKFTWNNSHKGFDWCEREYENYIAAVEEGLDWAFPYTDYLGSINGVNFYIQEKACPNEDEITDICYSKVSENYESHCAWREERYRSREYSFSRSELISDAVEDLEDDERVEMIVGYDEKLMDFLYNRRINDLHNGNFGYNGDHYVIIDFSGYGEDVRALKNRDMD